MTARAIASDLVDELRLDNDRVSEIQARLEVAIRRRNETVQRAITAGASWAQIGDAAGLSRQRIGQIAASLRDQI